MLRPSRATAEKDLEESRMGTTNSQDLQESLDQAFDLVGDDSVQEIPEAPEVAPVSRVRRSTRSTARRDVRISTFPQWIGVLLILAAFGLAVAPQLGLDEAALTKITLLGVTPGLLFVTGVLLAGLAWLQSTGLRSSARALSNHIGTELATIGDEVAAMAEDAKNANPNAMLENEFDGHRQILAKIETMVANLTKAVRMHNKPLVDIVGLATDLNKQATETQQQIAATKIDLEALERGLGKSTAANEKHWEGLVQRLHGSENEIEGQLEKSRDVIFERLERYIVTENERLTSEFETHCELLREQLESILHSIETNTTGEIRGVASRVDELAKNGAGATASIDPSIFAGLERNIAQVRDTVELLASRPSVAATTQTTTAPTLGSPKADPPRTAPAPQPAPTASTPSSIADGETEGPGGKRVMSAIERLKKMRGN